MHLRASAFGLCAALAGCHAAGAPRYAPDPEALDTQTLGPHEYRMTAARLSVEILLRVAGEQCAAQKRHVDVLKAEPARAGQAAAQVHYRCVLPSAGERDETD